MNPPTAADVIEQVQALHRLTRGAISAMVEGREPSVEDRPTTLYLL